jgi:hypothetical protein
MIINKFGQLLSAIPLQGHTVSATTIRGNLYNNGYNKATWFSQHPDRNASWMEAEDSGYETWAINGLSNALLNENRPNGGAGNEHGDTTFGYEDVYFQPLTVRFLDIIYEEQTSSSVTLDFVGDKTDSSVFENHSATFSESDLNYNNVVGLKFSSYGFVEPEPEPEPEAENEPEPQPEAEPQPESEPEPEPEPESEPEPEPEPEAFVLAGREPSFTALYFSKFVNPTAGVFLYKHTHEPLDRRGRFTNLDNATYWNDHVRTDIYNSDASKVPNYGYFPSKAVPDQLDNTPLDGGSDNRRGPSSVSMWVYIDLSDVEQRFNHPSMIYTGMGGNTDNGDFRHYTGSKYAYTPARTFFSVGCNGRYDTNNYKNNESAFTLQHMGLPSVYDGGRGGINTQSNADDNYTAGPNRFQLTFGAYQNQAFDVPSEEWNKKWSFWTVTWNSLFTSGINVYVNGTDYYPFNTNINASHFDSVGIGGTWSIGALQFGNAGGTSGNNIQPNGAINQSFPGAGETQPFIGYIADFRVYDKQLSQEEITDIYNGLTSNTLDSLGLRLEALAAFEPQPEPEPEPAPEPEPEPNQTALDVFYAYRKDRNLPVVSDDFLTYDNRLQAMIGSYHGIFSITTAPEYTVYNHSNSLHQVSDTSRMNAQQQTIRYPNGTSHNGYNQTNLAYGQQEDLDIFSYDLAHDYRFSLGERNTDNDYGDPEGGINHGGVWAKRPGAAIPRYHHVRPGPPIHNKINEYGILTYNFFGNLHKAGGFGSHNVPAAYKDTKYFSSDMHRSGEIRNIKHIFKVPNTMRQHTRNYVNNTNTSTTPSKFGAQLQFITKENLAVSEDHGAYYALMDRINYFDVSYTKFIYGYNSIEYNSHNSNPGGYNVNIVDANFNIYTANSYDYDEKTTTLINTYRDPSGAAIDMKPLLVQDKVLKENFTNLPKLYKTTRTSLGWPTYSTSTTHSFEGGYLNAAFMYDEFFGKTPEQKQSIVKKIITGPAASIIYLTSGRFVPLTTGTANQFGPNIINLPIVYSETGGEGRFVLWDYTQPIYEEYLYDINVDTIVYNGGAWAAIRNDGFFVSWGSASYGAGWEVCHRESELNTHFRDSPF